MLTERIPDERRVVVAPFTRLREDGEMIVGRPETNTFLVIEPEAVEVLDWLAGGSTVGEARRRYLDRHGCELEIQPFLEALAARGFVRIGGGEGGPDETESAPGPRRVRFHLEWVTPRLARRVFGRPTLALMALLAIAALAALVRAPELVPSWRALYFPDGLGLFGGALAVVSLLLVAIHELGHFLAARAAGVSCRFGIGNRLWIPVAETDMTGIWAVPRRRRYLPLLAGPLVDATGASVVTLLLFAVRRGWIELPLPVVRFSEALLLIYLLALLWQCYVFVRTDFYYVLANLLRCKSLMADTRDFLRNLLAAVVPAVRRRDQSHLPPHELRAARWFSLAWLGGRLVALGALAFIQLPLLWSYLGLLAGALGGPAGADVASFGRMVPMILSLAAFGLGITLWLRHLSRRKGSA